ncbi:MAG: ankyrin repeat domain-containing protein [Pseudomonadota bacterium]
MPGLQGSVDVVCSHCGHRGSILAEALPRGKTRFNVTCSNCKEKTVIDFGAEKPADPTPLSPTPATSKIPQMILDHGTNDPLKLPPGEFFGRVVIDRPLTLEGRGKATWIGARQSPTIRITSHGVVIRNVMVEATYESAGIAIEAVPGTAPILDGVILRGGTVGIPPENMRNVCEGPKIRFTPPPPLGNSRASNSVEIPSPAAVVPGSPSTSYTNTKTASLFKKVHRTEDRCDLNEAVSIYEDFLHVSPGRLGAEKLHDRARKKNEMSGRETGACRSAVSPCSLSVPEGERSADPALNAPLHTAATHGEDNEIRRLLDRGTEIDLENREGWTPLMEAACCGHTSVVGLLLDRGAEIDHQNRSGRTALMFTAAAGHASVVKLLLARGAKTDSKDNDGRTALILAASRGHARVVRLLLNQGADAGVRDNEGSTALNRAQRHIHTETVKLLEAVGAPG